MNFHVGQKIVCVDDSPGWVIPVKKLVAGQKYTVLWAGKSAGHDTVQVAPGDKGWAASRFRPATDISVFTNMLTRELEPV